MKKFKWIQFEGIGDGKDWYAFYDNEELGYIEWYPKWKKFVWNQNEDIIMSVSCLQKVLDKIKELEDTRNRVK